jgi:hypothetical protein
MGRAIPAAKSRALPVQCLRRFQAAPVQGIVVYVPCPGERGSPACLLVLAGSVDRPLF